MEKYIDADKLKSIIKVQINERKEWMKDMDRSDRQDQLWSDLNGEDMSILQIIASLQQETSEISLEEFTEKMEDWKARYNYPDNIPIKATMAFTARMFYMYPDIAREWYGNLSKATQD